MSSYESLLKKIKTKQAKVGVIGLGYVGLPLAILLTKRGYPVNGFVRSKEKKELIESSKDVKKLIEEGRLKIEITSEGNLKNCDIFIICVPTPVTEKKIPDLTDLCRVANLLSKIDLSGKLIINESTVAPFTTAELLGNFSYPYFLACSPERIDPGNRTKTTQNIPKVLGGQDRESRVLAKALYQNILDEDVVEVSSLEAAEMTKMLENTYRAVNIALVNEFAKLADECKIDILEVIEAAKTKWSFQAHYPGIGVGGHCIPVDPYYILALAKDKRISMDLVKDGLVENESMADYLADKLSRYFKKDMNVLVYGITYKKDVSDTRESPVITFCKSLKKLRIPFEVYDPIVGKEEIEKMGFKFSKLKKADIFVVGTDHWQLAKDFPKSIDSQTIIIDGRNFFRDKKGRKVIGIGRTIV